MRKFNNFTVNFNNNHMIKNLSYNGLKINLLEVSELDNPLLNVFVKNEGKFVGLLNKDVEKKSKFYKNGVSYTGCVGTNQFTVEFVFEDNTMYTNVVLSEEAEIVYTQDIGLNSPGNTLYGSQYIDNRVYENENGYNVIMRRTLKTETGYPLIQTGANKKVVEYGTEGLDIFTKNFRATKDNTDIQLMSRERNYELSMTALKVVEKNVTFASVIKENHAEAVTGMVFENVNFSATLNELVEEKVTKNISFEILNGNKVVCNEEKLQAEVVDGVLLSYFDKDYAHIVMPEKEVLIDRQHAHIMTSKAGDKFNTNVLVSSNYMTGVFWAQNAISNTGQHTYNRNTMSYIDVNTTEGLRIFIKENGKLKLLNMPSRYEVGFNYSKWTYQLEGNLIEVKVYTSVNDENLRLEFTSEKVVDIVAVESINSNFEINNNEITPKADTLQKKTCPNLKYFLNHDGTFKSEFKIGEVEVQDAYAIEFNDVEKATIILSTYTKAETLACDFDAEKSDYRKHFDMLLRNMRFEEVNQDIEAFNITLYWYMHNGLIHFATPHGVEQHAGAAWGTRDVCQGPVELFSAFGHYNVVREVLLHIFKNQNIEDGNWQQWFMFDDYHFIRYHESHGDVVVWPLKALSDYLVATNDVAILDEKIPFYGVDNFTEETFSLMEHVNAEIEYIKNNFIEGTYISKYLDGDWDDTLQPTNDELRQKMASGWTVPLTYQAISTFAKAIASYDADKSKELAELAENIKSDYMKYFYKDGVAAGFIIKDGENVEYLLHPRDEKTGISYRLLPINRGIISGMFDAEQAGEQVKIIDEHLMYPDGVRLMNCPVKYNGGVETIFQRGESASTVGREISLQYIHAHIRYIEAMCKIDEGKRAYDGLKIVNPIMVNGLLKNANIRQRNAYFSSTEGDFNNRYEYSEQFDLLKTDQIGIKSGWRIYSSGPGIYLKQLLTFMNVKFEDGNAVIGKPIYDEISEMEISVGK